MLVKCRVRCSVSEDLVSLTLADDSRLQASLHFATRSKTFCHALETSDDGDDFSLVAPDGYFQRWLSVAYKSAHVHDPQSQNLDDLDTEDALQLLMVREMIIYTLVKGSDEA
jgi:hypothetical protein